MTLTTLAALALLWLIAGVIIAALLINGASKLDRKGESDQQARDLRPRTPLDWDDFDARR